MDGGEGGEVAQVRPMLELDLDSAERVLRLAFGTIRGLPDPHAAFGDADLLRSRFHAAPDAAWVAEIEGKLVGSVLATRWGSFAFFGPLSVHPSRWGQGVGAQLLRPVLEAFERWGVRQAGLFTTPTSVNLGLYQKHGFWPGALTQVLATETPQRGAAAYELVSGLGEPGRVLDEIRTLAGEVFPGLDISREVVSANEQGLGDTVLLRGDDALEAVAVCHCGPGSEAGADTCYVKFAAARPGPGAVRRFELLLDACEAFASRSGQGRLVTGVDTGRLDAYRRLLARGFRTEHIGVSMWLHPERPRLDTPADYVLDDLR